MRLSLVLLLLPWFPQDPDTVALLDRLADGTLEQREEAFKALSNGDESTVRVIHKRLESATGELRLRLLELLERLSVPRHLRGVLPPIARVTIDARDRSLKEVLQDFQRQTRTPMRVKDAGDARVTVACKELSQLQALDSICKAAKIGWDYPSMWGGPMEIYEPPDPEIPVYPGLEMRILPGAYREIPRLFIRHYLVELHEIVLTRTNDFRKGKSRGVLNFGMHWPAGVNPYMVQFEVKSVLDNRGNELFEGHDDPNEPKGPRREFQAQGQWYGSRLYHRYRIRYPDKGVKKLSSIKGEARFQFLLRERKVAFESMEKLVGEKKEVEGVTAEFLEIATERPKVGPSYPKARLRIKGRGNTYPPRIQGRLEDGRSLTVGVVPVGDPAEGLFDVYLYTQQSKIVSLDIVAESICGEDAFEFEFKDLALP